jgi:hypothetical protein
MQLTAESIAKLVRIRAEISDLTKKEEKLTADLKTTMHKKKLDEYGPTESPWKLVRIVYDRSNISWKDQWKKRVKQLKLKWRDELKKLQKRYSIEVESLTIEPNEDYKK